MLAGLSLPLSVLPPPDHGLMNCSSGVHAGYPFQQTAQGWSVNLALGPAALTSACYIGCA